VLFEILFLELIWFFYVVLFLTGYWIKNPLYFTQICKLNLLQQFSFFKCMLSSGLLNEVKALFSLWDLGTHFSTFDEVWKY
jgi:hypothetical protein